MGAISKPDPSKQLKIAKDEILSNLRQIDCLQSAELVISRVLNFIQNYLCLKNNEKTKTYH